MLTFHSSTDFLKYFTSKIDTIRDHIVTMQPSATVSHQIVQYRSPEEQLHSFSIIGEEELYKRLKLAKPTTCMLDPIPSKLLNQLLPEVIDPLLAILAIHTHTHTHTHIYIYIYIYIFRFIRSVLNNEPFCKMYMMWDILVIVSAVSNVWQMTKWQKHTRLLKMYYMVNK